MTLPITPGRYRTRSKLLVVIVRITHGVATGETGDSWRVSDGRYRFVKPPVDDGLDLVERIGDL